MQQWPLVPGAFTMLQRGLWWSLRASRLLPPGLLAQLATPPTDVVHPTTIVGPLRAVCRTSGYRRLRWRGMRNVPMSSALGATHARNRSLSRGR